MKPILQLSGLGPDAIPEETRMRINEVMPLYHFHVEGRGCALFVWVLVAGFSGLKCVYICLSFFLSVCVCVLLRAHVPGCDCAYVASGSFIHSMDSSMRWHETQ